MFKMKANKVCHLVRQTLPGGTKLPSFVCVNLAPEYTEIRDLYNTGKRSFS